MSARRAHNVPSQTTRVLRMLKATGRAGITQADFLQPNVCDAYGPITRLAARISDLRREGHVIDPQPDAKRPPRLRDGYVIYQLVHEREHFDPAPPPTPAPLVLVDDLNAQGAQSLLAGTPYDPFSDAA